MAADSILIGIPEIAGIANVSRPAVSNWRKRYDDFPEPRVQSDSGVLFDLRAIEEWLLSRRKIDQPIPHGSLVWRVAEALRASWPSETPDESASSMLFEFTSSWLCYLEACARAADVSASSVHPKRRVEVPAEHRWSVVRESTNTALAKKLRVAAKAVEAANPQLVDLLACLAPKPFPDPALVRSFVAELEAAVDNTTPRFLLFEQAQQNVVDVARTSAAGTTPNDVSSLIAKLVGNIESGATVVDPACGTGGLLLLAAPTTTTNSSSEDAPRFVGTDLDQDAARYARTRFFLSGVDAEISTLDSLQRDPSEWPAADVVLCDPPYGLSNWGDADLYRSPRWVYGAPSPSSADLAWVERTLSMLKPTGRAAVVVPPGNCSHGGRERAIREAMVRAGVIEAVIHLPPRLRRDASIPLTIWLLRAPLASGGGERRVLLVDASGLGTPGRSTHELSADDIGELTSVIRHWRSDETAGSSGAVLAVAVDVETLIGAGADLTPRRYFAVAAPVDLKDLREARSVARAAAERAVEDVQRELLELPRVEAESTRRPGPPSRLGIREVAEILRPSGGTGNSGELTANAGDLLLTMTATGFTSQLLSDGDRISGHRSMVIRALPGGPATPTWLLLWTRNDEFAGLVERYTRGTYISSLSVKDLSDFELDVPSGEVQALSADLLDHLERLQTAQDTLTKRVEDLRSAELRLLYAEVTP